MAKKISEVKEAYSAILEISRLLNTDLQPQELYLCIKLCEAGIHPEAVAAMVIDMKKQVAMYRLEKLNNEKEKL